MNQSSAYKPVAVPKDMSTDDTTKGDTANCISSLAPTKRRAVSPAQNAANRKVKPKPNNNTVKRKRTDSRQAVSGGGNQIILDSPPWLCWLLFCCWQLSNKSWYLPRYNNRLEKRINREQGTA